MNGIEVIVWEGIVYAVSFFVSAKMIMNHEKRKNSAVGKKLMEMEQKSFWLRMLL